MVKKKEVVQVEKMTPEEERAYWDAQDPLRQGKRVRVRHPQPPEDRLSYFALRLSSKDIVRLAQLAQRQGMRPSELARALILQGLEQAVGRRDLERRVTLLAKEIAVLKRRLNELTKGMGTGGNIMWGKEPTVTVEPPVRRGNGSGLQWEG